MSPAGGVSAIVLAGGRSSRFRAGETGASKLDADLGGATVLDRTIERLRLICDEVIVVGRAAGREDVRFVADREPFGGPLAAMATGLEACTGEIALVVGGDMPRLHADVLRLLVDRVRRQPPAEAALLAEEGEPRPLPLAVRREPALAAALAALGQGERALRQAIGRLDGRLIPESEWRRLDPDGESLADVDTAADLERLREGG